MGQRLAWTGLIAILVGACGQAKKDGDAAPSQTGGSGGDVTSVPVDGSQPLAGAGGDGATPTSQGGEGGAEPALPTPARFVVLEPLPPREEPVGASPGEPWEGSTWIGHGSLESGLLVGTSHFRYPGLPDTLPGSSGSETFVWSEATGVVAAGAFLGIDPNEAFQPSIHASSADGSALFGILYQAPTQPAGPLEWGGFWQWREDSGMSSLDEPADVIDGAVTLVSADGTTAVGWFGTSSEPSAPFRYTKAGGFVKLGSAPGWPVDAELLLMSKDGTTLVGRIPSLAGKMFQWREVAGRLDVGSLPGLPDCSATQISSDGSVIVGRCKVVGLDVAHAFRWTKSSGTLPLESAASRFLGELNPGASEDGTVVMGTLWPGHGQAVGLARWTDASGIVVLPAQAANPEPEYTRGLRLNAKADVAFGNIVRGVDSLEAFRWTEATGVEPLGFLPGHTQSEITDIGRTGLVGAGRSSQITRDEQAVVWDGQGIRGVAAELTEAGVDLKGMTLDRAERLASGSELVVQGLGYSAKKAWVAWLPARD